MATVPTTPFAALIREKRIAEGLTVEALARLVGVHKTNVHKAERGETFPTRSLPAYVEVLGITWQELTTATGLGEYELRGYGVTPPDDGLAVPVATDFFTREQIHRGWFQPVDLTALGA